ncbi:MAG: sugar phosphate isomerase/epimerase [Acuticoccus sp.]
MNPRIALCNEVLGEMPFAEQCAFAAALGYEGIELAPFTVCAEPAALSAGERAALRRTAADAGLAITSLHWLLVTPKGLSLTDPDADVRVRTIAAMTALCDLAADLGAPVLVHGSPQQRRLPENGDTAAAETWTREAFAAAARAAEKAGVTYCVEPLARPENNNILTLAEAVALVDTIASAHFRTMLDTSAAGQMEREPLPALIARHVASGHIAHVQLNDPNRRGPGEGAMRFGPVLKALADAGYAGDIALEPFIYEPDGRACAARSVGYVKGVLDGLSA